MRRTTISLLCIFSLLTTLALTAYSDLFYLSKSGYYPNGLYDLGDLKQTDFVNITLRSQLFSKKTEDIIPVFHFYKLSESGLTIFDIKYHSSLYRDKWLESAVYFKESGYLYFSIQIVSATEREKYQAALKNNQTLIIHEPDDPYVKWQVKTYEIEIFKNNKTRIVNNIEAANSFDNAPVVQFSVPNPCLMHIKIELTAQKLFVKIVKTDYAIYIGNTKEFDFQFPDQGTYYIIFYPNQSDDTYLLPITKPAPYTVTLTTYCDNYCGRCRPTRDQGPCKCQAGTPYNPFIGRCIPAVSD